MEMGTSFLRPASPRNSLPACYDRTGYSAEKAGLSCECDDFGLSLDWKKLRQHSRRLSGCLRNAGPLALRDPESLEYVQKEIPEAKSCLIPDSLFAWFSLYANGSSYPPLNGDFLLPHPEKDEYWGKLDFSQPVHMHRRRSFGWQPA